MDPIDKRELLTKVEEDIILIEKQVSYVNSGQGIPLETKSSLIIDLLAVKVQMYSLANNLINETMQPKPLIPWD